MRTSIDRRIIAVTAVCVALSGADAFAAEGPGVARTGSASRVAPSAGHIAPTYKASAPRFGGSSAVRHSTTQAPAGARTFKKTPVMPRSPASSAQRKIGPRVVRPHQPPATTLRKGGERAAKWSHSDRTGKSKLDAQTAKRLREWRGQSDTVAQAHEKHRKHGKHHHDHDWWRHQCDVMVLIGWGYWGWHAGWWYPAWGYDPYYSYYEYDGPIYSYDGLPPDQIIANVQGALQRLGYYRYAVDGMLGPLTQAALKNYQRDHGLAITGAIDPQTLTSLGFTA